MEGDGHAEDGQDDRLVLLVHVDFELLHLALAGQLTCGVTGKEIS